MLSCIENMLSNVAYDAVYICGDMNVDPFGSRFWRYFTEFFNDNNLTCFDFNMLSVDTFTYISNTGLYCKWLDHVVGTSNRFFDVT